MKIHFFTLALVTLLLAPDAHAGIRSIEMTDGTVIQGEIQSVSGGIYTIKSGTLGTIRVEESKIRSIGSTPSMSSAPAGSTAAQAGAIQEKIMMDQDIMAMIQSLQNDPEFKKAMEDPELLKAVETGDIVALMANPRFMKLLDHSTVKDIQKKVK